MKSDNKENTVPNQSPFTNPLISSKMAKQSQPEKESKVKKLICNKHSKPLSNLFCSQCLSYNLCRSCISATHSEHEVMQFTSEEELINETKEILLENLEETLKDLKSKENEVKSRTHEINLIRNSVRALEEEMVACISSLFRDIETQLIAEVEKNHDSFNAEVEQFFKQFNQVNDELRDNLMTILDGKISIGSFDRTMVKREAPELPDFMNYKNVLERHKKIFKDLKSELTKAKGLIEQHKSSQTSQQSSKVCGANSAVLSKFDKYIENGNQKGEKVNQSFMKTLKLIGMANSNGNKSQAILARKIF